ENKGQSASGQGRRSRMKELLIAPVASAVGPGTAPNVGSADPANRVTKSLSVNAGLADASSSSTGSEKRAYPPPAEVPTQQGPRGIQFDFNDGCRVMLPETDQPWRGGVRDIDTGHILFETELKAGRSNSPKPEFVPPPLELLP